MPEHLKKYVNRRINPSYFTDYDKTYISGYKSLLIPQKDIKKTIYCLFTVNDLFIAIFNLYHTEPLIIPAT